jgi:hypothetical protein
MEESGAITVCIVFLLAGFVAFVLKAPEAGDSSERQAGAKDRGCRFCGQERDNVVGKQQLRRLAKARAAVVRAFLVKQAIVDSTRLFQKSGDIYKAPAKGGEQGSRVEFKVSVE